MGNQFSHSNKTFGFSLKLILRSLFEEFVGRYHHILESRKLKCSYCKPYFIYKAKVVFKSPPPHRFPSVTLGGHQSIWDSVSFLLYSFTVHSRGGICPNFFVNLLLYFLYDLQVQEKILSILFSL